MGFQDLLDAFREQLRVRIRNGLMTERGLARLAGLSQSHIHNVLKGERVLTPHAADLLLEALGTDLADLIDAAATRRPAGKELAPAPRRRRLTG